MHKGKEQMEWNKKHTKRKIEKRNKEKKRIQKILKGVDIKKNKKGIKKIWRWKKQGNE